MRGSILGIPTLTLSLKRKQHVLATMWERSAGESMPTQPAWPPRRQRRHHHVWSPNGPFRSFLTNCGRFKCILHIIGTSSSTWPWHRIRNEIWISDNSTELWKRAEFLANFCLCAIVCRYETPELKLDSSRLSPLNRFGCSSVEWHFPTSVARRVHAHLFPEIIRVSHTTTHNQSTITWTTWTESIAGTQFWRCWNGNNIVAIQKYLRDLAGR